MLFNFLNELVFYKDAKQLLFSSYKIKINQVEPAKEIHKTMVNGGSLGETFTLYGALTGEKLDMKKHELIVDVKAVTMHLFEVRRAKNTWKARVVLDI